MVRRWIALFALCLGALTASPALAAADTGDIIEAQNEPPTNADGWQAGTCITDAPLPEVHCGPQTGPFFFKTAAGHPPIGFTNYIIQNEGLTPIGGGYYVAPITPPLKDRTIKTLRVDLPPGLTVNPNATEAKCSLAEFLNSPEPGVYLPECSEAETKVGEEEATLVTNAENVEVPGFGVIGPEGFVIPPTPEISKVPVFNLQPNPGEPALFGFVIGHVEPVFLETEVAWDSDFHESFTIHLPNSAEAPGLATLVSRLVNFGAATGDGTYINNPTTCFDPTEAGNEHLYSTWFRAESYGEEDAEFPAGSTPIEAKVEENTGTEGVLVQQEGCDAVPFGPGIEVEPGTSSIDSPAPATVDTTLEYLTGGESEQQESHLRRAEVTLPQGMGLNPSASVGLEACTDAQFKEGVRTYSNECPAASVIGSAEIVSPPLAAPLTGSIYVGEQKSSDPASGEEFRILVEAKEENEGIDVRLVGHTKADPSTGQLTTVFDEQEVGPLAGPLPRGLPQAPFESVKLRFDGAKSVLSSPPTCATSEATGQMEPWARPGEQVPVMSKFTLSADPAGGSCPTTLAARRFAPGFDASTDSPRAGEYSPFHLTMARTDGEQEIKLANITLPEGMTGKLAGIPYCSEEAIAAAASRSGKDEQASPSCSDASKVGTATTISGTGASPLSLTGNVYLAGPYKGAPLSLAVLTPAVSGPFDLGTVVVRVALNVDPLSAQVNAVSDAIPDVFGGVKLDIRQIDFSIDRSQFMVMPTNCQPKEVGGSIDGGGGNPADSAAWSTAAVGVPYQPTECRGLKFRPKFHVRLKGSTKRTKFPQLRATLEARKGDANIARTALNLPHAFLVEQGHMGKVCTRPQLASQTCPKNTIYGHAEARSPLLSGKLKGPVYLVPGGHTLPDLVADLRGQVNIQLHGVVSSKHGGIKTVFNHLPDVPVTKFVLNMKGGSKGLIVNSADDTCMTKRQAILNIKGQNGKKVKTNHFRLDIASCPKPKNKRGK